MDIMKIQPEEAESDYDDLGLYISSSTSNASLSPPPSSQSAEALPQSAEPLSPQPEKKKCWLVVPTWTVTPPPHDIPAKKKRWLDVPTWTVDPNDIQTEAEQVAASLWKYCRRVSSTFFRITPVWGLTIFYLPSVTPGTELAYAIISISR
jgi:hypothetical protein